jgi:translation elongation factor EF-Ts
MSDQDLLKKLSDTTMLNTPLDEGLSSQSITEGLKFTISKTQENVQLVKAFKSTWNPDNGEVMEAYIHGKTANQAAFGKIGSVMHLRRADNKSNDKLRVMASNLAMHIAAMKPVYLREEDIPDSVRNEILESEEGERALKKFIKRDVLWLQELATAEKSETVGKFF